MVQKSYYEPMSPERLRASIALVIVTLLMIISALMYSKNPERSLQSDLDRIKACQSQNSPFMCSSPFIKHMLDTHSASEVMDRISGVLQANQCHFEGHVVGQQLYIKTGSVESALSLCSRQCDSSCVHGVVGEAFAEELGFEGQTGLIDGYAAHQSEKQMTFLGARLCRSLDTCHGVGHAIFQATKDIKRGMALCDSMATSADRVEPCYSGVGMEYADVLGQSNIRRATGMESPSVSSLASICNLETSLQRRACLRYLARFAVGIMIPLGYTEDEALEKARTICESLPAGVERVSCMGSIGLNKNYLVMTDPEAARRRCDVLERRTDKAACVLGQISIVAQYRYKGIAKYCATFPDIILKKSCYQDLFHSLYLSNFKMGNLGTLCAKDDEVCTSALSEHTLDSKTLIQAL